MGIFGALNTAVSGLRAQSFALENISGNIANSQTTAFKRQDTGFADMVIYDDNGSLVNVQFRWAKIYSVNNNGADTWNFFYLEDGNATGTDAQWRNVGQDYSFGANGSLNQPLFQLTLSSVAIGGVNLGDINLVHGSGGIT